MQAEPILGIAAAAVIATAGGVTDSTAPVIGTMIVAPLMTLDSRDGPLDGYGGSPESGVSFLLVAIGAGAVLALGWLLGHLTPVPVVAATNSQAAGRVDPTLGDLIAALATGAVGSFALVRDDVSDTLPGVAIAISLVPPLAVVGLTLESGGAQAGAQAAATVPHQLRRDPAHWADRDGDLPRPRDRRAGSGV